ncbi:hypothetical protein HYW42_04900 [Candidatus Daviesbacteria bacterium]|nr:hypothetical protein [Candidatus Daviesbacteria bacterium]
MSRLTATLYVFIIGLLTAIGQIVELLSTSKSGDQVTDLLRTVTTSISTLMAFIWSGFWIYAAYALYKNKRDNFPAIATWLILLGLGGVGLNYAMSQYQIQPRFEYNPFVLLLFYAIPIILIIVSWKTEPIDREDSVERARRIFGEHIKHLDNEDLHHTLK